TPKASNSSRASKSENASSAAGASPNEPAQHAQSKVEAVSSALQQGAEGEQSNLLSPVHIPEDPEGILKETHPAMSILANSSIVVQRQLEMMNVMLGFEQANKYVIMDGKGAHIGYLAEQEHGMGNAIARQMLRTHRSFTTHVFDKNEREVLRFHRPFSWISSRIRVYDAIGSSDSTSYSTSYSPSTALQNTSANSIASQTSAQISLLPLSQMRVIGEAQQQWAPLRRKYNLFLQRAISSFPSPSASPQQQQLTSGDLPLSSSTAVQLAPNSDSDNTDADATLLQFAYVDEPFLSWDFTLRSQTSELIGSVNRNFAGFAREIFTDTGVYALRMDAASLAEEPQRLISQTGASQDGVETGGAGQESGERQLGMTLDQRAVMLATAVSIDFDYFSRHSSSGAGGFMPLWFPGMGGGAAGAGAAGTAGAAGEAGAVGGAVGEGVTGSAAGAVGNAARGPLGAGEGAIAGAGTMAGYEAMQRGVRGRGESDRQRAV
ncbi:hypothetical protein LTR60_005157, partial [Cryomyces antarcticus]